MEHLSETSSTDLIKVTFIVVVVNKKEFIKIPWKIVFFQYYVLNYVIFFVFSFFLSWQHWVEPDYVLLGILGLCVFL